MFNKGMSDMLGAMLGINAEEIQNQIGAAMQQAGAVITDVQNKLNVIIEQNKFNQHNQTRIIKLLESLARSNGLEISAEEINDGPGNGSNVRSITKQ